LLKRNVFLRNTAHMAANSATDEINLYDIVSEHFGSQNEDESFFPSQTSPGEVKFCQDVVDYNSVDYNSIKSGPGKNFGVAGTYDVDTDLGIGQEPGEVIAPSGHSGNSKNLQPFQARSRFQTHSGPRIHPGHQTHPGPRIHPEPRIHPGHRDATENTPARKRANRNRNRNRNFTSARTVQLVRSQQIVRVAGALYSMLHGNTTEIGAQLRNYMMNENFGPDSLAHAALKLRYAMDEILFLPDVARYFNERR